MTDRDHLVDRIPPLAAYVLPIAIFLLVGNLEGQPSLTAVYPWIYTAKVAIVLGMLWLLRKNYPRWCGNGVAVGILVGVAGVVVWIGLAKLNLEAAIKQWLPTWLIGGARVAYNPFDAIADPVGRAAFLAVRMFGLAVVIPLAEEVFWRGFLLRYLIDPDFEKVPVGVYTPASFAMVTLCFTLVHPEMIAAFVWCAAVNVLLYRSGNLWSCIIAHAVTNLLLGVYVIVFAAWELW